MAKKPFSIRIESHQSDRFKALATVKNKDSATFFTEMLNVVEKNLTTSERNALDALLNVWKEEDSK